MEAYALNEVPICGHAIAYGRGSAAQALSSSGRGYLVMHGRAASAGMALASDGSGTMAALGRGVADLALTASARGYLLVCGIGDVAHMVLSSIADGRVIPVARGVAAMTLSATGNAVKAALGSGLAHLRMALDARGTLATRGTGAAELAMDGSAGIPDPVVPMKATAPNAERMIWVEPDGGAFMVDRQDRTIWVAPEDRTIIVEPERI